MEEEIILKVKCTDDYWLAYGPGSSTTDVVEQVAKEGPFPQKYFPRLVIKKVSKERIVIADGNDERVLTPHSRVSFSYEEEGREWSDGCVCDGHEYYVLITWE